MLFENESLSTRDTSDRVPTSMADYTIREAEESDCEQIMKLIVVRSERPFAAKSEM